MTRNRRRLLAATLVAAAALLALWAAWRPRPVSLVIIAVDTLRADELGCYGAAGNPTPALDALAAEGTRFDAAFSAAGWTLPSFASMLTGLYPPAHGAVEGSRRLPDAVETLAEALRRAGYRTAAFTGGGWLTSDYGVHQGFDVFDADGRRGSFAEKLGRALDWVGQGDEPFLLFLHGYDVHDPYTPKVRPLPPPGYEPPEILHEGGRMVGGGSDLRAGDLLVARYTHPSTSRVFINDLRAAAARKAEQLGRPLEQAWREEPDFGGALEWVRANYCAEVRELDQDLGVLLAALEQRGILDDAIVVLVADHGEAFMEHGRLEHRTAEFAVARVPLLLRLPARVRESPPQAVPDVVRTIDLAPTLLDYAGVETQYPMQGRSLRALLEGAALPAESACTFNDLPALGIEAALRTERWTFLTGGPLDPAGAGLLFDRQSDPGEGEDVSTQDPGRAASMRATLEGIRARGAALVPAQPAAAAPDRDTLERLRELGYLDGR